MSEIKVRIEKRIGRPMEEVRSQFLDIDHHTRVDVHKGFKFTVLEQRDGYCHFRQETTLLGMRQVDEIVMRRLDDHHVIQEYKTGLNAGGRLDVAFRPQGTDATVVDVTATMPVKGVKKLFAPLLVIATRKLGEKALEEDRVDLEERGYPARARVAAATA